MRPVDCGREPVKPVLVEWWDAHSATDQWCPVDDIDTERRVIRTLGWLIRRDRDHLFVAQSWDKETGCVDAVLKIPRPNVMSCRPPGPRTWWGRFG